MATIAPITTSPAASLAPQTTSTTTNKAQTQKNQFLQLLVAQLKGQNPLDPLDGTQFVSQLAQFSSLEELTGIHEDIGSIQSILQSSAGSNTTAANSTPTNKGVFQV
jgi:flagellar basal-body rod modification protein FlgD